MVRFDSATGQTIGFKVNDAAEQALNHVRQRSVQSADNLDFSITLNFHPDLRIDNRSVIDLIAAHGSYRSQYETGTSSGGLTAHRGGDRWNWESRIFGAAYDEGEMSLRPKYGALNYRSDPIGGSPRFGSCHFRLAPHVRGRTTFCYPDSHLEPEDFAVSDVRPLIALAKQNERGLDPWLNNYIEAHVHGQLAVPEDCAAIVLDPSYRETTAELTARRLGCHVEWHNGFVIHLDHLADYEAFRGAATAEAIKTIAEDSVVTPAIFGRARSSLLDYQMAKWVWHCLATFGLSERMTANEDN
jgi:Protein of unknown function (DUF3626)